MLHDRIVNAPISYAKRVLDVGCGTSSVTRRLADIFPNASIVGVDLSLVPTQESFPSNVSFMQGDINELARRDLQPSSFDYIFSRMLVYGMEDWPSYLAQMKDLLAPGGWLELQEVDMTGFFNGEQKCISDDWTWLAEQKSLFATRGLDICCGRKLGRHLSEAGFENVSSQPFRWMLGPWDGHPETEAIASFSTTYTGANNFVAFKKAAGSSRTDAELAIIENGMKQAFSPTEDGKHLRFWVAFGQTGD